MEMHFSTRVPVLFAVLLVAACAWPLGFPDDSDYSLSNYKENVWNSQDDENSLEDQAVFNRDLLHSVNTIRTRFSLVPDDPTNNQGAGPFKFQKPAEPLVKKSVPVKIKTHIPTISDETPLYLNYAEKEDGRHGPPLIPAVPVTDVPFEKVTETENDLENEDKKYDPEVYAWPDIDAQQPEEMEEKQARFVELEPPEIDYTQRLAYPDFSEWKVKDMPETLDNNDNLAEILNNIDKPDQTETYDNNNDDNVPNEPESTTIEVAEPEVVTIPPVAPPQHLRIPADTHYIPTPQLDFLIKALGEKRAVVSESGAVDANWSLVTPVAIACTGAAVFACVAAAIIYRRNKGKRPAYLDDAEPAYGVTGPPVKPSFLDLSGDRSLAKSAETYHYQHQKNKILSSGENNPSSGGSTSEPKSGDHSDYDTEDDEEENEDYGDYTVYECPGLAPPGEIEVVNPMFAGTQKKDEGNED